MARKPKIRNYLTIRQDRSIEDLSIQSAESDDDLGAYYIGRQRYYARVLDLQDQASVFIGPKGVGKSAILQMIRLEHPDFIRIVNITPDDLAFATVGASATLNPFVSEPQKLQFLFKALWEYLFCVELLRQEHKDRSIVRAMLEKLFGGKATREIQLLLQLSISAEAEGETLSSKMLDLIKEVELTGSYQDISVSGRATIDAASLKMPQLKLLQLITNVSKRLPDTLEHCYIVLIDDLDLHWNDTPEQDAFLGALLLSVRRLTRANRLKFCISLRENIFASIPIEDKDKFRDYVSRVEWDKDEIKQMVEKRVAFVLACSEQEVFGQLFEGDAFDTMWRHTMGVPRELIRVAYLSIIGARKNSKRSVQHEDVLEGIRAFSVERVEDLTSFHRTGYPGLNEVIQHFRGGHKEFGLDRVSELAIQLAMDVQESPVGGRRYSWAAGYMDDPKGLARILLDIGFLMIKENRTSVARSFDVQRDGFIRDGMWFAIHPMYGPALDLIDRR